MNKDIVIYTDGACSGNPGPGGWGAIVALPDGNVFELGGGEFATTNNKMELRATIEALRFLSERDIQTSHKILFFTDSTYVIRGITQWIWGWKKNSWKTAEGAEVQNRALWEELSSFASKLKKVEWKYSRGHTGIPGNERCDRIAVGFSQGERMSLYEGSIHSYNVDIFKFPEDSSLPDMKSKTEKKAVHSYLSLLGGIVYRHKDWGSCERRVKGQSGAKFKKTHSPDEELEVLKSWGLPPTHTIKNT